MRGNYHANRVESSLCFSVCGFHENLTRHATVNPKSSHGHNTMQPNQLNFEWHAAMPHQHSPVHELVCHRLHCQAALLRCPAPVDGLTADSLVMKASWCSSRLPAGEGGYPLQVQPHPEGQCVSQGAQSLGLLGYTEGVFLADEHLCRSLTVSAQMLITVHGHQACCRTCLCPAPGLQEGTPAPYS